MPGHKFTYWKADRAFEDPSYAIRLESKQAVQRFMEHEDLKLKITPDSVDATLMWCDAEGTPQYKQAHKVIITYGDRMHLIQKLMGEGGGSSF